MKKIVESKIGKSIIITITFLILFNLIIPSYTYAATDSWAGVLIEPVSDLVCALGDACLNIMQGMMMPGSPKAITKRSAFEAKLLEKKAAGEITEAQAEKLREFNDDIKKDNFLDRRCIRLR